ncbi:hypothetical protein MO387_03405 [Shewanella sp. N2AIL]|uniref:hypothetical protein n=1 Tax=Shewanella sp. N2AIL TaxID=2926851 RepID=UPI001F589F57|nr:hypothetical protein [Shewanella sp. N2AIL]MCI2962142.1 hypothetical protein [Shewanella sp. N2AIL]
MILYDPHCDDNIFTPLSYYFGKRNGLKKYEYIKDALDERNGVKIYISYKNSSLPQVILNKVPPLLMKFIVMVEVFFWSKLNKIDRSCFIDSFSGQDVFCFGYKKFSRLTHEEVQKAKSFSIHLTHYHTYGYNTVYLEPNVNLLYDSDVSLCTYFKTKFIGYKRDIIVMPFYVKDRFFSVDIEGKKESVAVSGTYHDINANSYDFGIYNRSRVTLHPIRHEIANRNSFDNMFKVHLGLYVNPNGLATLIKRFKGYGQKEYFSFDIAGFYASCKFSLVAGEGTGVVAIGALESLAAGCIPFLMTSEAKGLGLPPDAYVLYNDLDELIKLVKVDFTASPLYLRTVALNFNFENSKLRFEQYIDSVR